jgi:hypothetical protein
VPATAFGDTAQRLAYCEGRLEEQQGHWRQAAEAYAQAQGLYPDADQRAAYCRGRLNEDPVRAKDADWATAAAAYRDITDPALYPDRDVRLFYALGRSVQKNRLREAADWYQKCEEAARRGPQPSALQAEAAQRRAYCQGRLAEKDRRWQDAVRAYDGITDGALDPKLPQRRTRCRTWLSAGELLQGH